MSPFAIDPSSSAFGSERIEQHTAQVMINLCHKKPNMNRGDDSLFSKSEKRGVACYRVTDGDTFELSGCPQDRSPPSGGSGLPASPCRQRLGGMTPCFSGDHVFTVFPYLPEKAAGIEKEPPEKMTAISGRLAATFMDPRISFILAPRLIGISDLFKGLNGSLR